MRQYRWTSLDGPGLELLEIEESPTGITIRGALIGDDAGSGFAATYHVRLERNWVFRSLNLQTLDGRRLRLRSDGHGAWTDGAGREVPALGDCVDIDLSGSPFTNTLPIRRARFEPGVPQRFSMAYVALDTLAAIRHEQIYTKVDNTHFRYKSVSSGYEAELTVDKNGYVVSYPNLFQRIED